MHLRTPRATRTAAAALTVLALAACSSGADAKKSQDDGSSGAQATPQQRLAQAKQVMDQAASMHLKLSSTGIPSNANGVLGGEGDGTHAPAFKGSLKAQLAGIHADVPVTAVQGKVWAKLPIWPDVRTIKPSDYGAPDPAVLFSKDKGLSTLLPKTQDPTYGATKRDGSDVVRIINGKLTGQDVTGVLTIGDPSVQYKASYAVTDKNEVRSMTLTGQFYNDATSAYTLRLDQYGKTVDIKPPA
ncbi:LppX_LprAFG lipoprotein [Luteipulveratus flavus]|uniref:LppX_LprAFG lipoprotein n=1 Tax=Luteipulveratus flavus TaxID=3031728 RepID=A0ABT6CAX7_9MICO|nr:LppX_LprAFG lipoprotein [Luteipulveratus sp. YIM 133296]MDF8265693.1 LppX_LprAFG lipoprotein [Luteipulveratus sp. YIM 133296]